MLRRLSGQAVGALYTKEDDVLLLKTLTGATPPPGSGALTVERVSLRHLDQIAEFNCRNCSCRRTRLATARMALGASAFLGFRGEELIGYMWWLDARGVAAEPRLARYEISLEENDVYGFDLFVAPQHRGHGTAVRFLETVEAELNRLGYRRMWSYVVAANRPARWLFATSGHTAVGRYKGEVFLSRVVRHDGALFLARAGQLKPLTRARMRHTR